MTRLMAGLAKIISLLGTGCILIFVLCKANEAFVYKTSASSFRWGTAGQKFIFQVKKSSFRSCFIRSEPKGAENPDSEGIVTTLLSSYFLTYKRSESFCMTHLLFLHP